MVVLQTSSKNTNKVIIIYKCCNSQDSERGNGLTCGSIAVVCVTITSSAMTINCPVILASWSVGHCFCLCTDSGDDCGIWKRQMHLTNSFKN